ncbi:MAG: hypothetical protein WC762_00670 [Methylobacter sp.]|jgi:hypothetical protein
MGGSKRTLENMLIEEEQKYQELLKIPIAIAHSHELIEELKTQLKISEKTITNLKNQIEESNSIKMKLKDYVIGGLIGAILGAILTTLI